mmetsp:Transcript_10519/g.24400  ORF Transcript_10519/g.24400 Transcript_10519/m.24400 type:complete len:351 (+) Transcript_10519:1118-2170(+)
MNPKIEISLKGFYINNPDSELARWFFLNVDGKDFLTLVSCNYALNPDLLKRTFQAKKVIINLVTHEEAFADPTKYKIIIDYNLTLGAKRIVVKSDQGSLYYRTDITKLTQENDAQVLDLGTYPVYKAKVSFVAPTESHEDYTNIKHPFFGISLENSNFIRPKLLASLEWICNRYKQCAVLIGDSIHRITIRYNEDKDEDAATEKAIALGKTFFQNEHHIFDKFNARCKFSFIYCSEIQLFPEYKVYHTFLENLFVTDVNFKNSVTSFSERYYKKRKSAITQEQWHRLIESSCKYFLEEFAVFACLKNRGMDGMIYPGSFSTLSEIAAGEHPNALEELKNLVVVSLHIKKR